MMLVYLFAIVLLVPAVFVFAVLLLIRARQFGVKIWAAVSAIIVIGIAAILMIGYATQDRMSRLSEIAEVNDVYAELSADHSDANSAYVAALNRVRASRSTSSMLASVFSSAGHIERPTIRVGTRDYVGESLKNFFTTTANGVETSSQKLYKKVSSTEKSIEVINKRIIDLEGRIVQELASRNNIDPPEMARLRLQDDAIRMELNSIAQETRMTIGLMRSEVERLYWILGTCVVTLFGTLVAAIVGNRVKP